MAGRGPNVPRGWKKIGLAASLVPAAELLIAAVLAGDVRVAGSGRLAADLGVTTPPAIRGAQSCPRIPSFAEDWAELESFRITDACLPTCLPTCMGGVFS